MRPRVHEVVESTTRPWRVVCVCDVQAGPDEASGGAPAAAGFAVTTGLAALGLPELLLPARPPWQEVAAGWRLSHRDLAALLDDLGEQLLCGDLWGFGFEADLEGGTTARLVPAGPVPVEAVEEALPIALPGLRPADGAATGQLLRALLRPPDGERAAPALCVVPWALDGGPVALAAILAAGGGPARGLLAADVAAVRARTAQLRGEILGRGGRPGHVPARWRPAQGRLPARPRPGAGGRFGPRHELVVARAEQLLLSDAALLGAFVALAAQIGGGPGAQVLGRLDGLAASSGRAGVPAELALAATDVTSLLAGRGGHAARWRRAWPAALGRSPRPGDRAAAERAARDRLHQHVHALLAAEAFSDVLPPPALLCGRLSWVAALVALDPHERNRRR